MASSTALERFEGMRVTFPQGLVIAEYFNYDRFGEIVLARPLGGEDRPFTAPRSRSRARYVARRTANLSRITLDDGVGSANPSTLRHPTVPRSR